MASMQLRSDYAERGIVPKFIGLSRAFIRTVMMRVMAVELLIDQCGQGADRH